MIGLGVFGEVLVVLVLVWIGVVEFDGVDFGVWLWVIGEVEVMDLGEWVVFVVYVIEV